MWRLTSGDYAFENEAIFAASSRGQTDVVKVPRVNPSADDNYAICVASENGQTDVVKVPA